MRWLLTLLLLTGCVTTPQTPSTAPNYEQAVEQFKETAFGADHGPRHPLLKWDGPLTIGFVHHDPGTASSYANDT